MPQDLQNSIITLVNSLDNRGYKSYATYSMLFCVIVHLVLWNSINGNYLSNRNNVAIYMHNYLIQHYRSVIPIPNPNTITNRLMGEIDKTLHDLQTNAGNLNVLPHIQ